MKKPKYLQFGSRKYVRMPKEAFTPPQDTLMVIPARPEWPNQDKSGSLEEMTKTIENHIVNDSRMARQRATADKYMSMTRFTGQDITKDVYDTVYDVILGAVGVDADLVFDLLIDPLGVKASDITSCGSISEFTTECVNAIFDSAKSVTLGERTFSSYLQTVNNYQHKIYRILQSADAALAKSDNLGAALAIPTLGGMLHKIYCLSEMISPEDAWGN